MTWARIIRAWREATQAFREAAASRKRIALAKAERRRLAKKKQRYVPGLIDSAAEGFILLALGILIGVFLLR